MTAHSELNQRARSVAHDISNPSDDGSISSTLSGKDVAERVQSRRVHRVRLAKDVADSSTIAVQAIVNVPQSMYPQGARVVQLRLTSDEAIIVNNSAYTTDLFEHRTYLGVTPTTVATMLTRIATGLGADTVAFAGVDVALTSEAADRVIPAGGCLTITRSKTSVYQTPGILYEVVLEAV
jgi:hypothetical protein